MFDHLIGRLNVKIYERQHVRCVFSSKDDYKINTFIKDGYDSFRVDLADPGYNGKLASDPELRYNDGEIIRFNLVRRNLHCGYSPQTGEPYL